MMAAAIDAGALRNSAAFAAVELSGGLIKNVCTRLWTPTKGHPVDLRLVVLPEVCAILNELGITVLCCDAFAIDQAIIVCAENDISIQCEGGTTLERWAPIVEEMHSAKGRVALIGEDGQEIAKTLKKVICETLISGDARVKIPTTGDYHGDLAEAWRRAVRHLLKRIETNGRKIHGTTRRAYNVGTSQISAYK